jgi:glycerophosphoryl diester phosphodiesterase
VVKPLIVARCGDVQSAPENTLSAFEQAILKGADVLEFDVHLTQDGEVVIHHDFYLGRTDNGEGYISDYTLAELRALDAGGWFDRRFAGEKMPTLAEVLTLGKGKIRFEIDMKGSSLRFLNQLMAEITRFDALDAVELTTAHTPLLFHVKKLNPALRTGMFFYQLPEWKQLALGQQHILDWMALSNVQVAHLHSSLVEPGFVIRLHENGFLVHGSNLNTEEEIKKAIASGVDQFSTDKLELSLSLRAANDHGQ